MSKNHSESQETFEKFLIIMDDQLEALEKDAIAYNIRLDLSISSLDKLEQLFNFMAEGVDKDTVDGMIVYFARYLGEIVRSNYGGQWVLPLDDPKNVNYNTPVITGHSQEELEFAPLSVMKGFALRRVPKSLKRAADAHINVSPIDLSGMIEE